jgi:uncharacterized phage-associated protein
MATVLDVAAYLKAGASVPDYDTMKLQKLVYFAQAWSLAWTGVPLFEGKFEAWPDGPVSRDLYRAQKYEGIPTSRAGSITATQQEILDSVLSYYGRLGYRDLIDLTHAHQPWQEARGGLPESAPSRKQLKESVMRDFYTRLAVDGEAPPRMVSRVQASDESADEAGRDAMVQWREGLALLAPS